MDPKLTDFAILKLIILFYLQKELKPPQEASVDIYKASQMAYNNELQHKEYQILADLWKNRMNSSLTVRKFLAIPTIASYSMDGKERQDSFNSRMEEKKTLHHPRNCQKQLQLPPAAIPM
ncbi:hypothetical protein O181_078989 [Austropuccinia psidii MF-1]|uniref:Uncharacterized protein n=1 Tax=Austropuccinia psidii MF-1 TaxID=1389203 RepID=A0A9Q3IHT9_9BASI|nr:hypothetical protein [Austropuccinia psidii MF-1]